MDKNNDEKITINNQNIKEIRLRQIQLIEEKECLLLEFSETLNAFMHQIREYQFLSSGHDHSITISYDEDN